MKLRMSSKFIEKPIFIYKYAKQNQIALFRQLTSRKF